MRTSTQTLPTQCCYYYYCCCCIYNIHPSHHLLHNPIQQLLLPTLHLEHLHALLEADGHPVLMRGVPLQLVDLTLGRKGQDGVLDHQALGRDVPDQRLPVVCNRADVVGRVWRPDNTVQGAVVVHELSHRHPGHSDVQDDGLVAVCVDGGQVVGVLLVPGQTQQRGQVLAFIQNSGVLQRPTEIIGRKACENSH